MANEIHVSESGVHHPNPKKEVAWTINDTRGYTDGGPICEECGDCECWTAQECECKCVGEGPACLEDSHSADCFMTETDLECIGLSFAYVCLDGGESLCENCAQKEKIEIVPCDCK